MRKMTLLSLVLMGLATTVAVHADGTESPKAQPATARLELETLQIQIQGILEEERATLAALNQRFEAASTEEEALAIQKQIHALKTGTETRILEAQVEYLEVHGKAERAQELKEILVRMKDPDRALKPALRAHSDVPATH